MRISRFPSLVDDVTVRLVAGAVLLLSVPALTLGQWWLYALLAADFTLRTTLGPSWSPLARGVQRFVRPRLPLPVRATAGPPKRFAAGVGAAMTTAAAVLWLASGATPALVAPAVSIGILMVVFPALEAGWGICAGCIVFRWLMRLGLVPDHICVECGELSRRQRQPQSAA